MTHTKEPPDNAGRFTSGPDRRRTVMLVYAIAAVFGAPD